MEEKIIIDYAREVNYPPELVCPITSEPMREPVFGPDGHTYEKEQLEAWIQRRHTSPITRKPMDGPFLPNYQYQGAKEVFEAKARKVKQVKQEKQYMQEQLNKMEKFMEEQKQHNEEQKQHNEEQKQQIAALAQEVVTQGEKLDAQGEQLGQQGAKLDGLLSKGQSKKRAAGYKYFRQKELSQKARWAAFTSIRESWNNFEYINGANEGEHMFATACVIGGVGGFTLAVVTDTAAVTAAWTALATIGTLTLPLWAWAAIVVGGVVAVGCAGYYGYKYYIASKEDDKQFTGVLPEIKDFISRIVKELTFNVSLEDCSTALSNIRLKLSSAAHSIYYALAEIARPLYQLLQRWLQDDKDAKACKIRKTYIDSVGAGDTNKVVPPEELENGPELEEVAERFKRINSDKAFPIIGNSVVSDDFIKNANRSMTQCPTAEIEGNSVLLMNVTSEAINCTTQALNAGRYEPDYTPVVRIAMDIDRGFFATDSKLGALAKSQ